MFSGGLRVIIYLKKYLISFTLTSDLCSNLFRKKETSLKNSNRKDKGDIMGFAETFKALSDPARRNILLLLRDRQLSAGEIGQHFDMTGAAISYHLNILKNADLVYAHRQKNNIYYELNTSVFEEVLLWFEQFKQGGNQDEN